MTKKTSENWKDHGQTEFESPWGPEIKLLRLSGFGGQLKLPGELKGVSFELWKNDSDIIVFSDKKGGGEAFKAWWINVLKQAQVCVFLMNFKDVISYNIENDTCFNEICEILNKFHKFISPSEYYEGFQKIKNIERLKNREINLVFYNPSAFSNSSEHLFQALRSIRDRYTFQEFPLRVVIINSSAGPFLSKLENSSYLEIASCYRIAFLDKEEISSLGKKCFRSKDFDESIIPYILKRTGGHPFLVQLFLQMIKSSGEKLTRSSQIDHVFRTLKKSPPDVTRLWMAELRQTLEERKELVPNLMAYLNGQTLGRSRFPPPAIERPLFFGGWLRENQESRWGISSDFHAHFARQVLLEMGVKL